MSNSSAIIRTYKYRIYPNAAQSKLLGYLLFLGREIYNCALNHRIWHYQRTRKSISAYSLRDYYCDLRKQYPDEYELLPAKTVDALIRRLDKAYKAFFKQYKSGTGFPKFKGRKHFRSLDYIPGAGIKFLESTRQLYIMNVGNIRLHYHRPLPETTTIKNVLIKEDNRGRWWACFQCEIMHRDVPAPAQRAVGIDIGMVYALALSDGQTIDNPRWYREGLKKRRVLNHKLDRQRRGNNPDCYNENGTAKEGRHPTRTSKRMDETLRLLRKHEDSIKQQRHDFWHNVTDWLTREYDFIAIEDLSLEFMQQNKRLAMSVADAAFSTFWQMLDYKAQERGCTVVRVNPAYTSQTCAECGNVDKESRRTQAKFCCVACGYEDNADLNAARVILYKAMNPAVQTGAGRNVGEVVPSVPREAQNGVALAMGSAPQ